MKQSLKAIITLTFFSLCAGLILTTAAQAATLTVTSTGDTTVGAAGCADGCSLREAITAAAAGDTINFSSLFNTAQTINVTSQLPNINKTLTITGTGARLLTVRRSGTTNYGIFSISAGTVRISGMTISNGANPNSGGGGVNSGSTSPVTLDGVTITGTSSVSWAAVDSLGTTLTILNSTISGNACAGVISEGTTVNIANSTISGNNGTNIGIAGGVFNSAALNLNNVTVANNVNGGIENTSTTNIRNTIITGSTVRADALGAFTSQGNNLVSNAGTATGFSAASGDKLNVAANLAALADNGGQTDTHALNTGSPAINAGNNCVVTAACGTNNPPAALTTDQRGAGFVRQGGTAVDIGAIEAVVAPTAPVVTAPANGSTVSTARPTYTGTAVVASTVTIYVDGTSIGTTTADGSGNFSFTQPTNLTSGSHTVYATATTTDGTSPNSNTNTFTVQLPTITVNPATLPNGNDGSVYSQTLTATGGTAPYTFAVTAGTLPSGLTLTTAGVLSGTPSAVGTFNFTITANDSTSATGSQAYTVIIGAAVPSQTLTVDNTTDDAALTACTAAANDCSLRGAILNANVTTAADTINFDAAVFAGTQTITMNGDHSRIEGGALTINGTGANRLTIDGGAGTNRIFYSGSVPITLTDMTLTGGNGTGDTSPTTGVNNVGGAVLVVNGGRLTANRIHAVGNSSQSGGALYLATTIGSSRVENSTFSGNTSVQGGAMTSRSTATIINSTFNGNTASLYGGAISCTNGTNTLDSVTITGNTSTNATFNGGGIFFQGSGTLNIGNSIIAGNITPNNIETEIRRQAASAVVNSRGYNLIGDSAGDSASTFNAITYQSTDILDTPPLLDPLANYGGTTPTMRLQTGSPAIDKGLSTLSTPFAGLSGSLKDTTLSDTESLMLASTIDQRGSARPSDNLSIPNAAGGNGADIGAFEVIVPTAANASIMGRVLTAEGRGITNVWIIISGGSLSQPRTVRTSSFGHYRVEDLPAGETYILEIRAKRYSFTNPTRIISLTQDAAEQNFVADEQ